MIRNRELDMYCYCNIDNRKYLGSKNMKIWSYEINEHCLITSTDEIVTEHFTRKFTNWLQDLIPELVKPHSEHMQSYLTGVIITSGGVEEKHKKYIEKFKFSKSFMWGLQGWCDLRLVVVDLTNRQVITNKKAEEVKQVYQPKLLAQI